MKLEGLHHITMITADAQATVDFYADRLGLRLVKKTVNFDSPDAYHLYFGDETGAPGSILTWFEFPGAAQGRPGIGMIHLLQLGVPSEASLDFWAARLGDAVTARGERSLASADPDGLALELVVADDGNPPLRAEHPEVPAEHALQGFHAARAYASDPERSRELLEQGLGFEQSGDAFEARGEERGGLYLYDEPPAERGIQGGGTVHHIAWNSADEDHEKWQQRVAEHGAHPTQVIDRHYFKSIYFREPSGVLFELATPSPGFTIDEPLETLGEKLSIPPRLEELRPQIEATVKPLVNPRTAARTRA